MQLELSIGQVANLLGITPKTIRHYHKLGILPDARRANNGYRVYSKDSLYRINLIKSLKQVGFSLSDIKVIIDAENPDDRLHEKLGEALRSVEAQIASLQEQKALIQRLISSEASLNETRLAEFSSTGDNIPESLIQALEQFSPQLAELEKALYKQIDMFQWGTKYEEFLSDVSQFLEAKPEFIHDFASTMEKVAQLEADDESLLPMAEDLIVQLKGTAILLLFKESSFAQDKSLFQTFLQISEDKIASNLSPGQKQFLELLAQVAKKQS